MIINEKTGYLFVQVPRTACSSMGKVLMEQCGGKSILTKHAHITEFFEKYNTSKEDCGLLVFFKHQKSA
jgi:hypothetical protein